MHHNKEGELLVHLIVRFWIPIGDLNWQGAVAGSGVYICEYQKVHRIGASRVQIHISFFILGPKKRRQRSGFHLKIVCRLVAAI